MESSSPEHGSRPSAVAALLERTRARLLHRIELLIGPGARRVAEAEDFLGQVTARVLEGRVACDPRDENGFLRLATRIARNLIVEQVRRPRVRRFDSVGSAIVQAQRANSTLGSPPRRAVTEEERIFLLDALEALDDDHRVVIEQRDFESRSFREIGEAMGRSESAAQQLHARAMLKLTLALAGLTRSNGRPEHDGQH